MRYLAPTGMLGGGFNAEYFAEALASGLDFIACDSGSIDGGPANLGGNIPFFSRDGVKRDLRLLLIGARSLDIPLLIGSCGGSGGRWNLNWVREIVEEIAGEEGLHFTLATIDAEPDRAVLLERFGSGRVHPLTNAPAIDKSTFTDAAHIVAMMGTEPYVEALAAGADVVLAGRSSDAALFAAIPVSRGLPPGLAWHAAKIMECGGSAVVQMDNVDGMICTITDEYFDLEPTHPEHRCSEVSIASHSLYETSNPFEMYEPGGVMRLQNVEFEQLTDRVVRVRGSEYTPAETYTVKLEGATLIGYRAMVLGGITDPAILDRFDEWLESGKRAVIEAADRTIGHLDPAPYSIVYRVYGRDAVIPRAGSRLPSDASEVGLLVTVTADSQKIASTVASQAAFTLLHLRVPEWHGLVSNLAYAFAPHVTDLGPGYSFVFNHVVELDSPTELFPVTLREV
ncbi:MAG: hypothetical protein JWQ19_1757 [Subtercola sp.]|nr:hypothetical protein [Subtercola sp.]